MPLTRKKAIKEPCERKDIEHNSLNFGVLHNLETDEATGEIFIEAIDPRRNESILVTIPIEEIADIISAILEVGRFALIKTSEAKSAKKTVRKYREH